MDTNLGWKGAEKYVATVPQVFDLWQDPQERYDIFMNNYTERTWAMVTISDAIKELMKTYVKYPPRKLQSDELHGPDHDFEAISGSSGCASNSERRASISRCRQATDFNCGLEFYSGPFLFSVAPQRCTSLCEAL